MIALLLATLAHAQDVAYETPFDEKGWVSLRESLGFLDEADRYERWLSAIRGSYGPAKLEKDTDGDGFIDWVDLCLALTEDRAPGREEDGCPEGASWEAVSANPPRPTKKDPDGDGITNEWDACPYTFSPNGDADGCPEPPGSGDADYDGLVSDSDACAGDAEDKDGFQDEDGCPDPDNDADAILDVNDACPSDPEDPDGFEDENGCPDPDNDADAVADRTDKCPGDAETVNGFQDEDGCPDRTVASLLDWPAAPAPAPAPIVVAQPAPRPAPVVEPLPTVDVRLPTVDGRLPTGQRADKDAAVVVGLEDYAFVPDVPYARRDADAFYNFLLYTRGVRSDRIHHLTQGSNDHIRQAVEQAGREAGPGGTVWVYFAGHGAASPTSRERVLLGDDVRADTAGFESRAIPVSEVEKLAQAGGARALLVLDTCFAGVGRGGDTLIAGTRFAVPAYATAAAADAAQWNAAGPNELSGPLAEVEHGAFTYFAVGALRGWADGELSGAPDGVVTAEEAQAYVTRALKAHQKRDQHPAWVGSGSDWVLSTGAKERGPTF